VGTSIGPGARLAGYTVERLLGRGGMGVVYLASRRRGDDDADTFLATHARAAVQAERHRRSFRAEYSRRRRALEAR